MEKANEKDLLFNMYFLKYYGEKKTIGNVEEWHIKDLMSIGKKIIKEKKIEKKEEIEKTAEKIVKINNIIMKKEKGDFLNIDSEKLEYSIKSIIDKID